MAPCPILLCTSYRTSLALASAIAKLTAFAAEPYSCLTSTIVSAVARDDSYGEEHISKSANATPKSVQVRLKCGEATIERYVASHNDQGAPLYCHIPQPSLKKSAVETIMRPCTVYGDVEASA